MGHPPNTPPSTANKVLLVAVSALVAVAVATVGLVLLSGGDDDPATARPTASPSRNTPVSQKKPIPKGRAQAAAVDKLLDDSAATRTVLVGAIVASRKCKTLPKAVNGFNQVAKRRNNQLRRTRDLKLDKINQGERLRGDLAKVFRTSLDADKRLLDWANKARRGCRGKPKPPVGKAPGRVAAERRATTAKRRFVKVWNPIAKRNDQPTRKWNGL